MEFEASVSPYEQIDVHALAVAVFKDEKPSESFLKQLDEMSGGLVKSAIEAEEFSGKEGETAYFHLVGNSKMKARRLLLVGVGDPKDYKTAQVSQMAGTSVRSLRSKNAKTVAIVPRAAGDAKSIGGATVEGSLIGSFEPDKYRTVDKDQKSIDRVVVCIDGAKEESIKAGLDRGRVVGESVNFTRDLANEPGASMTPTDMAARARQIAEQFGLTVDILDEDRMEQEGMGSLLSVARGSDQPATLIVLKYTPANYKEDGKGLLALVGKGVTFREAHGSVGQLVRQAEQSGVELDALPLSAFVAAHQAFGSDVHDALSARASVARREVDGGTGPRAVRAQLDAAIASLAQGGEAPRGNELSIRAD